MSTYSAQNSDRISETREFQDKKMNFMNSPQTSSPKTINACSMENIRMCEVRSATQSNNYYQNNNYNCTNSDQSVISACATPGAISENFSIIPCGNLPLYDTECENQDIKEKIAIINHAQISKAFISQISDLNTLNNVINEIIMGLGSENKETSTQSVYTLYLILKDEKLRSQVSYLEFIIKSLVKNFIFSINDPALHRLTRLCAACLHYISLLTQSAISLFEVDLLSLFINLPLKYNEVLLSYLISPIHSIFLNVVESRLFLSNLVHLKNLVYFINYNHKIFQSILFECILICFDCINVDFLVKETDFLTYTLRILKEENYDRLIFNICRILREISKKSSYKGELVKKGFFNVMISLLKPSSRRVAVLSLNILKNLSELASNLSFNFNELIDILICFKRGQLSSIGTNKFDNQSCQLIACDLAILANITCNNSIVKEALIKAEAVPLICQLCSKADIQEVLESAFLVLKHLTCRNRLKDMACLHFINSNGMFLVVEILQKCSKSNLSQTIILKKSLFGLLTNIASVSSYLSLFSTMSVTQYVAHSLAAIIGVVYNEKQLEKHDKAKFKAISQDYIKLLEYCVAIMYYLTSDSPTLSMMVKSNNLLCLFCKLLVCSSGTTLAYVICFLSTISSDENGLKALERAFKETQNQNITHNSRSVNICIDRLRSVFHKLASTNSKIHTFMSRLLNNLLNSQFKDEINSILIEDYRMSANTSEVVSYMDINSVIDSPINV